MVLITLKNTGTNYKDKVIKAKDIDSEVTGMSTGHPVRVLKNKLSRQFRKLEKEGASPEELEDLGQGALPKSARDGDIENGSVMAGQIAGLVVKEESCKEIIEDVINSSDLIMKNFGGNNGK